MGREDYWFASSTANVVVNVTAPTGNDATFVSQTVPSTMVAGQTYSVSVTMKNTGTTTWTAANNHKLGSQNPADNTTWGTSRATLAASVAPGAQHTFTYNVTAPATAGTYNFQWGMLQEAAAMVWCSHHQRGSQGDGSARRQRRLRHAKRAQHHDRRPRPTASRSP